MIRRWLAGFLAGLSNRVYQPTAAELEKQFTTLVFADGTSLKLAQR